jgi:hypothetical protein
MGHLVSLVAAYLENPLATVVIVMVSLKIRSHLLSPQIPQAHTTHLLLPRITRSRTALHQMEPTMPRHMPLPITLPYMKAPPTQRRPNTLHIPTQRQQLHTRRRNPQILIRHIQPVPTESKHLFWQHLLHSLPKRTQARINHLGESQQTR